MKRAKELRADARLALQGKYWRAFLASLIALVLGGIAGSSGGSAAGSSAGGSSESMQVVWSQLDPETARTVIAVLIVVAGILTIIGLAMMIVGSAVELGYNSFNIELFRTNEKPSLGILFSRFSIFGKALWLRILTCLKILAWTLLLVIPGIIAGYRYAMAPFILAENPNLTANEAIERSKALMAGNKWRLFCLQMSFIGWMLLSVLTLGIGVLFLQPYVKAADTAFYLELTNGSAPQSEGVSGKFAPVDAPVQV